MSAEIIATIVIGAAFLAVVFCVLLVRVNVTPAPPRKRITLPPAGLDVSGEPCACGAYQPVGSKKTACYWCGRELPGAVTSAVATPPTNPDEAA